MLKEMKIEADPSPKPCCNEQCRDIMFSLLVYIVLVLICVGFGAGLLGLVHWLKSGDQPDTHISFSIVSVSVSELNPNASSLPEFHIVFQAQKAFENSTEMYLYGESTNILYHGINIASVVNEIDYNYYYYHRRNYYGYNCVAPCYNVEDGREFVIPVPLSSSVPGYLRKQLWEQRDIIVLDLEMDFISIWSWYNYHVSCNNVTLGAVDTRIPCNATMM